MRTKKTAYKYEPKYKSRRFDRQTLDFLYFGSLLRKHVDESGIFR